MMITVNRIVIRMTKIVILTITQMKTQTIHLQRPKKIITMRKPVALLHQLLHLSLFSQQSTLSNAAPPARHLAVRAPMALS
jgi:hypothetical protein